MKTHRTFPVVSSRNKRRRQRRVSTQPARHLCNSQERPAKPMSRHARPTPFPPEKSWTAFRPLIQLEQRSVVPQFLVASTKWSRATLRNEMRRGEYRLGVAGSPACFS